jgi:hypothetical protein
MYKIDLQLMHLYQEKQYQMLNAESRQKEIKKKARK